MKKTAYDYAHEKDELRRGYEHSASQPKKDPFQAGFNLAAAGAVVGGGVGLLASFGRVPLPKMRTMAYGASLGALAGGAIGSLGAFSHNVEKEHAEGILAKPEPEQGNYLAHLARQAEIAEREAHHYTRHNQQVLRDDLRTFTY